MSMNWKTTWSDFVSFRQEEGFPSFGPQITLGNKEAYVETTLSALHIEPQTELLYVWEMKNGKLWEKIRINEAFSFKTNTLITSEEKECFFRKWITQQGALHAGFLHGKEKDLTVEKMGWALLDDLQEHLYTFVKEEKGEKLWVGGGYQGNDMAQHYYFRRNHGDSPWLEFYLLNGGMYYFKLKPLNRLSRLPFLNEKEVSKEEEEQQDICRLTDMAHQLYAFLQNHTVNIDPTRGVTPIPDDDESEEL